MVTGGSGKLGRVIAKELAKEGATVIVQFFSQKEEAQRVVDQIKAEQKRAVAVGADLTSIEEVQRIFSIAEELGGCDLLINSAGIWERRRFADMGEAAWKKMLETDLFAPFYCCRAAFPSMKKKGGGDIINLVDVGGGIRPWREYSHYCTAKAGLAMLTKCLALELAPAIRVNGIAPGIISGSKYSSTTEKQRLLSRVPLQYEGNSLDVAGAVRYLLQAKYVTGQILAVDGGRSIA